MPTTISCKDAEKKYGITTSHSKMDNGELRFRLKSKEGDDYIKTIASPDSGWQNSHYHKNLRETYIVQKGWMAYAEKRNGQRIIKIHNESEVFTTESEIVHNVYLPANAVIHTVKHGKTDEEDRTPDDDFNNVTQNLTEEDIKNLDNEENKYYNKSEKIDYSEEYRHFDNLIWQLPTWSTAIFLGALIGVHNFGDNNVITEKISLSKDHFAGIFLILISLVMLTLTHSVHRFRIHQSKMKNYHTAIFTSASFYLQLTTTIQSFFIVTVSIILLGVSLYPAVIINVTLIIIVTIYREYSIRKVRGEYYKRARL